MVNLNIKDRVKTLLEQYPHLRDSDERLCANIWHSRIKSGLTASDFLAEYASGKLPSSESITRCRRKVQEECPELRGENYVKRQAKQEQIQDQLGYRVANSPKENFGLQKIINFDK
jgi:hypothetical protein